jgi:hypothetical protein
MMRTQKVVAALAAILALGLIAAGCGGGDDTSTVTAGSSDTTSTAESSTTSTTSSSGATPEDVYNECLNVIKGTSAEATGQTACQQARDAFEQCAQQAQSLSGSAQDTAVQACQSAADQTVDALKAAGG